MGFVPVKACEITDYKSITLFYREFNKLYHRANESKTHVGCSVFMRSEIVLFLFGRGFKQTDFVLPQIRVNAVCVMPRIARTLNYILFIYNKYARSTNKKANQSRRVCGKVKYDERLNLNMLIREKNTENYIK